MVVGLSTAVVGWLRGNEGNQTKRSADRAASLWKNDLEMKKTRCWMSVETGWDAKAKFGGGWLWN